jgi:hypothetical protein
LPPGLSARDAAILRSVKKRAHYLDKGFSLCGIRFGWTFFIGLIPIAGDAADAILNYLLVVRKARQADLPDWLVGRMLLNNAISVGIGLVPFVGDVLLAVYKANSRNAALLDEFLRIRGHEFMKMREAEETGQDSGRAIEDIEQLKPGSGMTSSEKDMTTDEHCKGPGSRLASPTGVVSKSANSGTKGKFVENMEL